VKKILKEKKERPGSFEKPSGGSAGSQKGSAIIADRPHPRQSLQWTISFLLPGAVEAQKETLSPPARNVIIKSDSFFQWNGWHILKTNFPEAAQAKIRESEC